MRIKLYRGKQKELFKKVKEKLSWSELSKLLGLSKDYLRLDVQKEKVLLSEESYKKLCKLSKLNFDRYIINRLKDNWGKISGGKISKGKTKEIMFPKDSEELAEFYGIMLGDGNLNKTKSYRVGTYMIRIVGDYRFDKEYLINYVKPIIEKLFSIRVRIGKYKKENGMFIEAHSVRLVEFLEKKEFKSGNKIKNQVTIPLWISANKQYLKACLRGLIDTDGSIFKMSNKDPKLMRISFTNLNKTLLKDTRNFFIKLRYHPSKIINNKHFFISRKGEIVKYLKEIGFSNQKHTDRLQKFKDSPVV